MAFDGFDDSTSFEAHKGTDPEPKRHARARKKAEAAPPTPSAAVPEPSSAAPVASTPAPRPQGKPRTGNWPARPYRPKKHTRGHGWAESNEWIPYFLEAYSCCGNVGLAASQAGVSRALICLRRSASDEFGRQVDEAKEEWKDRLRAEVKHRAIEGEDVWIYDKLKGELVFGGKRKSDLLLMFHAKMEMPEYRDNYQVEAKDQAMATAQAINVFLGGEFRPTTGDQADIPTFDQFLATQGIQRAEMASIEAPSESAADRRARLLAELAALDAEPAAGD